jgi:hypothetical protein
MIVEWLEIAVHTPADGVEPVSEMFIECGTGGVVVEDPALILQYHVKPTLTNGLYQSSQKRTA